MTPDDLSTDDREMTMNLEAFGYLPSASLPAGTVPGRVVDHRGSRYRVVTDDGEVPAVVKGSLEHHAASRAELPCVGDFVALLPAADGLARIAEVLPRWSTFSRADFAGRSADRAGTVQEQVVATNFDHVFILCSLNDDFNVHRILRYVTQTYQSGGQPVVVLTKADRDPHHHSHVAAVTAAVPGVPVHAISAHTGEGMADLDEYLQPGTTTVCLGSSGVGKSSLLNALLGDDVAAVSAIREADGKGRHTTTHRQLFLLPSGAMLIDTPGMRELGLFDAHEGKSQGFADIEELAADCRYRDCAHEREPGCAVQAAVDAGSVPARRWEQYLVQSAENRFVSGKAAYLRDRESSHRQSAKAWRQTRRSGLAKPDQR